MRWLPLILSLIAVASIDAATVCHESDCRVDDDGTLWCYNQEVDCDLGCHSCADVPVECVDQYAIIECSTAGERSVTVAYVQRDPDDWETYPCPVGAAVEGEESDPGSWGQRTHYSTVRGWYRVGQEPGTYDEEL